MTVTSLVAVVAPRTGKIIKISLSVFWKRRKSATKWCTTFCINLLQNGVLHFVFKLSQLSQIVLQRKNLHRRKTVVSERGLALKGLTNIHEGFVMIPFLFVLVCLRCT